LVGSLADSKVVLMAGPTVAPMVGCSVVLMAERLARLWAAPLVVSSAEPKVARTVGN
jgi:hypothetical protein